VVLKSMVALQCDSSELPTSTGHRFATDDCLAKRQRRANHTAAAVSSVAQD